MVSSSDPPGTGSSSVRRNARAPFGREQAGRQRVALGLFAGIVRYFDLAGPALARVKAPTLLIVGGLDISVISMNREALAGLVAEMLRRAAHAGFTADEVGDGEHPLLDEDADGD